MAAKKRTSKKRSSNWGGARPGAGRPRIPEGERRFIEHRPRPKLRRGVPVLVTMTVKPEIPSLLKPKLKAIVNAALVAQHAQLARTEALDFRVLRFALERNRILILVEADSMRTLGRGVMGFMIRAARALNPALGRDGRLWADRYHARPLETPAERRLARDLEPFKAE